MGKDSRSARRSDRGTTDEKIRVRTAELMSQLRLEDNESVQSLTNRGNELNVSMRRGLAEVRQLMYGPAPDSPSRPMSPALQRRDSRKARRAPWEHGSDSESDDGRRDKTYLSEDGRHVVQRQYKMINGHLALIAYRRELDEVDPDLLATLREKRDKELAKRAAKEKKRQERRRARSGESGTTSSSSGSAGKSGDGSRKGSVRDERRGRRPSPLSSEADSRKIDEEFDRESVGTSSSATSAPRSLRRTKRGAQVERITDDDDDDDRDVWLKIADEG